MSRSKVAAPEVTERWQVTWWQVDDGVERVHEMTYDHPTQARHAYSQLDESTDPKIHRWSYDIQRARWSVADVMSDAVTPAHVSAVTRRGVACLRAIIRHRAGTDSRGTLTKSLDEALATDGPITADPRERLVTDSPATCVVCDYLCEHGLPAMHATPAVQTSLLDPERF